MPNPDDRLLKMSREELEAEARSLGLQVTDKMSRAELITLIEQHHTLHELQEHVPPPELRLLLVGLLLVTLSTFVLALDTFYELALSPYWNPQASVLVPIYLALRGIGGFLMAAALFSLALKPSQSITPQLKIACMLVGVIILLFVIPIFSYQWILP